MKVYVNWENQLKEIKRWNGSTGSKFVKDQLKHWCRTKENIAQEINNYIILDILKIAKPDANLYDEFLVVRNDYLVFKSFETLTEAVDYCLDKINTESEQLDLFQ